MARKGSKDRGVTFKEGVWWVRVYANGREKWFRSDTKSQAKVLYGRLKAEQREGRYFPKQINEARELTLKAWITRCLAGSINRDEMMVNLKEINQGKRDDILLRANDIIEVPGPTGVTKIFQDLYKTIVPTITNLPMRVIY